MPLSSPLVCRPAASPNVSLPLSVVHAGLLGAQGALHVIGCAAAEGDAWLTLVVALPHWDDMKWTSHSKADAPNAGRHVMFRGPVRHRLSWVKELDVKVVLQHGHACKKPVWHSFGGYVNCSLSDLSTAGRRLMASFSVATHSTPPRRTGTVQLILEPANWLVQSNEKDSRALVWTGAPAFLPPCRRLSVQRVRSWAAQWRRAGFEDVIVHVREPAVCRHLGTHLQQSEHRVGCIVRKSILAPVENATIHGRAERRDYSDQGWHNMLGLALARVAGYSSVAFVDLDELPPKPFEAASGTLRARLQEQLMASDVQAWTSFFFRPHACDRCPTSSKELVEMLGTGACNASTLGWAGDKLRMSVTKVFGIPSRMTSIDVHSAEPAVPLPRKYSACLEHPAPPFEVVPNCSV